MRFARLGVVAVVLLSAGCGHRSSSVAAGSKVGRYEGIGVFDAGPLWAQVIGESKTTDDDTARLADDEHIIVVLDSHTGEVRQCGDHSGHCAAMNPWSARAMETLPVRLSKHAEDVAGSTQLKVDDKPAK